MANFICERERAKPHERFIRMMKMAQNFAVAAAIGKVADTERMTAQCAGLMDLIWNDRGLSVRWFARQIRLR